MLGMLAMPGMSAMPTAEMLKLPNLSGMPRIVERVASLVRTRTRLGHQRMPGMLGMLSFG